MKSGILKTGATKSFDFLEYNRRISLNERLLKIASLVNHVETVIDVGTDHGYLPVYLVENSQIQRAIVSDISRDSLRKAIILAKEKKLEDKIEARQGAGFHVLKEADKIDVSIVAGMGGHLIATILEENKKTLKKKKMRLILQPMQNPEALRKYLLENNYRIIGEHLVQEERFIYQILEAVVGSAENKADYSNFLDLEFGSKIMYTSAELPLYRELLLYKKSKLEVIIERVQASQAENKAKIIEKYREQIRIIEANL